LLWSKKLTPSFGFPAQASVKLSGTTIGITGGLVTGNGFLVIDTSATNLSAFVSQPDQIGTYATVITTDGLLLSAGLAHSTSTVTGDMPSLTLDHPIPTLCSPAAIAMAQSTFQLDTIHAWTSLALSITASDASADLTIVNEAVQVSPICLNTDVPAVIQEATTIWPNPALDHLMIEGRAIDQVWIMDDTSRLMIERNMNSTSTVSIDLTTLAPGAYQCRLHSNASVIVRRFIKE
jgi:hypothetical protein